MKKILIVLLFVAFLLNVKGQDAELERSALQLNTITTAVPFLLIAPDSRAGAMGDVGVASSPDGNSMHWNVAKLAFVEKEAGVSISYSPWLRKLVPDINLSYVSGYKKLSENNAIGASLRYFSLGNINFTDEQGSSIGQFNPAEFAFDVGYSQKFGERFAGGIAVRYIYSNLTGGINVGGGSTQAGKSFAVDVGAYYTNPDAEIFGQDAIFSLGLNISNIGAKISYTDDAVKDFIPINMRLGQSLTFVMDDHNSFSFLTDFNKLLVPTPPIYATDDNGSPLPLDPITGEQPIEAGKNPDVPIVTGIFQSFGDAPGGFSEELKEINISVGLEYWYNKQFAIRAGYFHEPAVKGNRRYITTGLGLKLSVFSIDFSYLIPMTQQNPLANTVRFSLMFDFDAFKSQNKDTSN
ncbi:MAG: type IX secretion system outer membrane channel protein PorV [Flavobacteriales bacterium]|nr:type IX secretion system outer membrane channel protein PorV [Flavobacteriales bacterium]